MIISAFITFVNKQKTTDFNQILSPENSFSCLFVHFLRRETCFCHRTFFSGEAVEQALAVSYAYHVADFIPEVVGVKTVRRYRTLLVVQLAVASVEYKSV